MKRIFAWIMLIVLALGTILPVAAFTVPGSSAGFGAQIAVVENGRANFRIVRKTSEGREVMLAASALRDAIKERTGVTLSIASDHVPDGAERDHNTYEILVGNTDYSESEQALEGVLYGGYVVKFVGNKLVINSRDVTRLDDAVDALTEVIQKNGKKGKLSLASGICLLDNEKSLGALSTLPTYQNGSVYAIMDAGDDVELMVIRKTDRTAYDAYCTTLAQSGYQLYAENAIRDNHFSTFTNSKYTVNIGYYDYEESVRLTIEKKGALPPRESDNQYKKVISAPTLAQLGLETDSSHKNGMSYVMQLSDGSFIIIDGGFKRDRDAQQLLSYLQRYAPNSNQITIAAWIITHCHSDHVGAFMRFCQNYSNTVTVKMERVISAFVTDEYRSPILGTEGSGGETAVNNANSFNGSTYIRSHAGQKYYLRDAVVEILYNTEAFMPTQLRHFNTTSVVFTIDIAGQRFLFLGDATNEAMQIVTKMYGRYLRSDFVQTAHHGYATGDGGMSGLMKGYAYAAPSVVLWPVGFEDYPGLARNYTYNTYLAEVLGSVKEILVAGNRDIILELPYTAGTSKYDTILK